MPSLNSLSCSIELQHSKEKLQEYGTSYGDAIVETYIAVPSGPSSFVVHLTSSAFIAEGLAMFVYIDGKYQCNRNRQGLKPPSAPNEPLGRRALVDFRVRQSEEKCVDGSMIAHEWTFERLNTVSADKVPDLSSAVVDRIGLIEVIVLRCFGSRGLTSAYLQSNLPNPELPFTPTMAGPVRFSFGLDGASDMPSHRVGFDGQHREDYSDDDGCLDDSGRKSRTYSNREHRGDYLGMHGYVNASKGRHNEPPQPYAKYGSSYRAINQHAHASSAIGGNPSPRYLYGSGPVRHETKVESASELFHSRTPDKIPAQNSLKISEKIAQMTHDAYRRGQEHERRRIKEESERTHAETHQIRPNLDGLRATPGDWPQTPLPPSSKAPSVASKIRTQPQAQQTPAPIPWYRSLFRSRAQNPEPAAPATPTAPEINPVNPINQMNVIMPDESSSIQNSSFASGYMDDLTWSASDKTGWSSTNDQQEQINSSHRHNAHVSYVGPHSPLPLLDNVGPLRQSVSMPYHTGAVLSIPRSGNIADKGPGWGTSYKGSIDLNGGHNDHWGNHQRPGWQKSGPWDNYENQAAPPIPNPVSQKMRHQNDQGKPGKTQQNWNATKNLGWHSDHDIGWGSVGDDDGKANTDSSRGGSMSTIRPSYARSKSHKQRSRPWSRNDCSNQAPCGPPAPEWGGAPSKSPPPPYSTLPDFMCNAFRKEDNRYGSSFKTTKTSSKTSERPSAREKGDLAAKTSWNLQNKENTDKLGGRVEEDLGTKEDSWNNIDGWGDGNSNSESSWGDASDGPPVPGAWDNSDRKDGQNKLGKDAGAANGWGIQNNENNNNSGRWGQVNSVNGGIGQSTKGENKKDEIDQNNNDWGSGNNDSNAQDTNGNGGWSRQNQTGQGNVWRGSTNTNFSGWGNQNNDSNNQNSQGQGWDKQDDTSGNNQAGQVDLNQGNDKLNVQNNSRNHCDKNNDSSNDQNKNSGAGTWNMGFDNKNINTEEKKNQPGEQAWNNDISNDQNNGFGGGGRGDNNDSDNKPDERSNIDLDNDAKLGKHSPTKSRLKSYRRRSKPTNVEPQAYWSFPPPQGKELQHGPQSWDDVDLDGNRNMYSIPEGPLAIPEDKAKEKLLDHQVKEGKGMLYEHCVGRPKYLDSLQKPYAVFRFHYRSFSALHKIFPDEVPSDAEDVETASNIERRLKGMSQEDVIKEYMKLVKGDEEKKVTDWLKGAPSGKAASDGARGGSGWGQDEQNVDKKERKRVPSSHGEEAPAWNSNAFGRDDQDNNWNNDNAVKDSGSKEAEPNTGDNNQDGGAGWGQTAWNNNGGGGDEAPAPDGGW